MVHFEWFKLWSSDIVDCTHVRMYACTHVRMYKKHPKHPKHPKRPKYPGIAHTTVHVGSPPRPHAWLGSTARCNEKGENLSAKHTDSKWPHPSIPHLVCKRWQCGTAAKQLSWCRRWSMVVCCFGLGNSHSCTLSALYLHHFERPCESVHLCAGVCV
jgi:hypothetical protein